MAWSTTLRRWHLFLTLSLSFRYLPDASSRGFELISIITTSVPGLSRGRGSSRRGINIDSSVANDECLLNLFQHHAPRQQKAVNCECSYLAVVLNASFLIFYYFFLFTLLMVPGNPINSIDACRVNLILICLTNFRYRCWQVPRRAIEPLLLDNRLFDQLFRDLLAPLLSLNGVFTHVDRFKLDCDGLFKLKCKYLLQRI